MYENSYTIKTLPGLLTNTYILAVVLALIFVGISILIASLIAYEGGKNPRDPFKRRVWFWILAAVCPTVFFLWNMLYVNNLVKGAPAQSDFLLHNGIATGLALAFYVLVGILLSKLMKRSKYGTLFPSKS